MIEYLKNLWAALLGRCKVITVEVPKVEYKDMSMTTAHMEEIVKVFPLAVWKPGITLEEFARSEGEQRVIQYIKGHLNIHSNSGPIQPTRTRNI